MIQPDQRLWLRLRIDTRAKEAQDMAPLETRGFALLQGPPPERSPPVQPGPSRAHRSGSPSWRPMSNFPRGTG